MSSVAYVAFQISGLARNLANRLQTVTNSKWCNLYRC